MRWEEFFGDDNEFQWAEVSALGSAKHAALAPFIQMVEQRSPMAALPRSSNGRLYWYVGWRTEADARFAVDLLSAFWGRTYAEMRNPLRWLVPEDRADVAFFDEFEGRAFR